MPSRALATPSLWGEDKPPFENGAPMHAINPADFLGEDVLRQWQERLDARGLRATASPEHVDYVADLAQRMVEVGIRDVVAEEVPVRRWTAQRWELTLETEQNSQVLPGAAYVPYSGDTGPEGVTGSLSATPAPGTVGVAVIETPPLTAGDFDSLDWDPSSVGRWSQGARPVDPSTPYRRVWLAHDQMKVALTELADGGCVAGVLVLDVPDADIARGYWLYDGVHRDLPSLFVGRETGAALLAAAASGGRVRVVLEAEVADARVANLMGVIPGATSDLVVLQSHTDGSNGIEDNGPEAILAMAEYLARQPSEALPSSILVLLTTGHFVVDQAWGLETWLERHRADLVPRITSAISLEHLGALPSPSDGDEAGDHEFGCVFATAHPTLLDIMRRALERARVTEPRVIRPFVPHAAGTSPDGCTWPGDGGPFWHSAGLPTANFITGPDYLLDTTPVLEQIDIAALRRQAIAFTEATLELAAAGHDLDTHSPLSTGSTPDTPVTPSTPTDERPGA